MKTVRILALAVAAVWVIAACAARTSGGVPTWTGTRLEGTSLAERNLLHVTVHYPASASPEKADQVGGLAERALEKMVTWGRADANQRVDLWVVPEGVRWPGNLPSLQGRTALAVAPDTVVCPDAMASEGQGLPEAVAVAVTQQAGSPVFQVPWLHDGMGIVLSTKPDKFPVQFWNGDGLNGVLEADKALAALTGTEATAYRQAAAALAALLIDRWGIAWPANYPKRLAELTPEAALQWATGTPDTKTALVRWQDRMLFLSGQQPVKLPLVNASSAVFIPTAADMSPIRATPKLPQLPRGPGPNDNYSPAAYEIRAVYAPAERQVVGEEHLTWRNGEGIAIDQLYFNLWPNAEQYALFGGAIAISRVTVDGRDVDFTARALDLVVPLGRQVADGQQVDLAISFVTRLPRQITLRVFGQDAQTGRFNLAHWFPILAVLDDRGWNLQPLPTLPGEPYSEIANFHVKLDTPAGTVIGATGHLVGKTAAGDRWIYEYDAPNVRDWVATGGRNLTQYDLNVDGVAIHAIEADPAWTAAHAQEAAKALALFDEKFGAYPYRDLVITCCAGLEYPGLFYSSPMDSNGFWRVTTYHELAHQWFYAEVGNDQYGEIWLDEGFARYGERLGVRAFGPAQQLRDLRKNELPAPLHVSSSAAAYAFRINLTALGIYDKGALVLEDLQELMGAERFDQLMHEYVRRYQFKTATTADFIRLASEIAQRNLDAFFREHLVYPEDRAPYLPLLPLPD